MIKFGNNEEAIKYFDQKLSRCGQIINEKGTMEHAIKDRTFYREVHAILDEPEMYKSDDSHSRHSYEDPDDLDHLLHGEAALQRYL